MRPLLRPTDRIQHVLRLERADAEPLADDPARERLTDLVGRRRDAVQPAEQHDLAVQVVGLDVAGAADHALPGRAATARMSGHLREVIDALMPAADLVGARAVD